MRISLVLVAAILFFVTPAGYAQETTPESLPPPAVNRQIIKQTHQENVSNKKETVKSNREILKQTSAENKDLRKQRNQTNKSIILSTQDQIKQNNQATKEIIKTNPQMSPAEKQNLIQNTQKANKASKIESRKAIKTNNAATASSVKQNKIDARTDLHTGTHQMRVENAQNRKSAKQQVRANRKSR